VTYTCQSFAARAPAVLAGLTLAACLTAPLPANDLWSLAPLASPAPPRSDIAPIDAFLQARLAEVDVIPAAAADRATFLRRATLDLTGLPPTREELAAYLADTSDDPASALIDRLLASPHYGERWGRHWLDVARYVQGSIKVPGVDRIDLAEPYRDYVVRAFNEDKPYDAFLTEQLAGDLLVSPDDSPGLYRDRLVAPAFLSIGPWFDECTDPAKLRLDIVDEQISTLTRAFLAMDFSCARCHDHKFDPIPTADYYALAGILRSTEITSRFPDEWRDGRPRAVRPLASPEELAALETFEQERTALRTRRWEFLTLAHKTHATHFSKASRPDLGPVLAAFEAENFAGHKNLREVSHDGFITLGSRRLLDQWVKYRLEIPTAGDYTLLVRCAAPEASPVKLEINGTVLPERVLTEATYGDTTAHFRWTSVFLPGLKAGGNFIRLMVDRHEPFPQLDRAELIAGAAPDASVVAQVKWEASSIAGIEALLSQDEATSLKTIDTELAAHDQTRPTFPTILEVADVEEPINLPVHPGGDPRQTLGEAIPRGVPTMAGAAFANQFSVSPVSSGRVDLAAWLSHPDNPLTARVMVNRIWQGHFGTGLVRTVDDFGFQGTKPTHPELLDWLAREFIASGWSIKHIHRLTMNSAAYQASSVGSSESLSRDPDAALLSRFPTRRLEVEAIYDSMLTSIGKVPRQKSRTSLDLTKSKDRALYILTSSRSPLGLGEEIRKTFPLFGFDESGRPMHQRDRSETPDQALWWLNNPLPRYYATKLAEKVLTVPGDDRARIIFAYETVLSRTPRPPQETAALRYLATCREELGLNETESWTRVCLGLFSSHSFRTLE